MIKSDSLKQADADSTNQLVLLSIGALVIFFVFQKQLAYSTIKNSQAPHTDPYKHLSAAPLPQKIMEIDQKTDGTVILYLQGKEYKISKPELNSESDHFIEKLMTLTQTDIKEIEYDTFTPDEIELTTPLSRLVTRLGFVGIKRDLFFPRTSKNSVLFRKYLTQQDLDRMNLTTDQILTDLESV